MHLITDVSKTALERINTALDNMLELVVQRDLEYMIQILIDYFGVYNTHYGHVVDRTQQALAEVMMMFLIMVNESDQAYIAKVNPTMKARAHILKASWDTLSKLDSTPGLRIVDYMPNRYVSNQFRLSKCETFQSNVTELLQRTVLREDYEDMSAGVLDAVLISNSDMNELQTHHMMHTSNNCVGELRSELDSLILKTYKTISEMLRLLKSRPRFENNVHVENGQFYLQQLRDTATWLSKQLAAYSENRTSKIDLSEYINSTMLSNTELALNHTVSSVMRKSINPLLSMADSILHNTKEWYNKSLNAFLTLVPFYDDSDIEDRLRALEIWRQPVARMETANILQFQHPASESWRTWDLDTSLYEFIYGGFATAMITKPIDMYRQILQSELIKLGMECKQAKDDVIGAFEDAIDDFESIRIESLMGSNFVL